VILEEPSTPGTPEPTGTHDDPPGPGASIPGGAPGPGDAAALALVQQTAWTLAWVAALASAFGLWSSWSAGPAASLLAPVLVLVALVGAAAVWTVARPLGRGLPLAGLLTALVTAGLSEGTAIHLRTFYTTDSAAFNQVATRLLLDGHNPYTASMAPAARLLHPAAGYWTYLADGGRALGVSYPAGSFLLQAPAMALGVNHLATDWVDLGAWLATPPPPFCLLSRRPRWLAPPPLPTRASASRTFGLNFAPTLRGTAPGRFRPRQDFGRSRPPSPRRSCPTAP